MKEKKIFAMMLAVGLVLITSLTLAESSDKAEAPAQGVYSEAVTPLLEDTQKLDASYTLALNAINAEDYAAAKKYLQICFVYCNPQTNPVMYADLLLKQACINVIEGDRTIALLSLDAALTVDPELADAYLVATQIYNDAGDFPDAAACLDQYIQMSGDSSLYETLAQLYEASGNPEAARSAYDKFTAAGGTVSEDAGFQTGLSRMEGGRYEEAIEAFNSYIDNEEYGAGAMYNIGVCQMNLGDYKKAAESFTESEKKGGTFSGLYYNRGICYLMSEDWENGAHDFINSIQTEHFVDDAKYNEETDEIQAIRTSLAMLETGKGGVDVSMYMFRDSKSDRMGEEKYNILFFDTPAGEEPLVMLITDVLDDRVLEMPRTLKVHLRTFQIDGADLPAYSLSNHLFVMCDGTDGLVSLFDGFYTNTFDGDIFDSAYVRIDGIKNNNLNVTIKKDQPIWPEKTDENHATDLNGDHYELVDNVWQNSMAAGEHHTL